MGLRHFFLRFPKRVGRDGEATAKVRVVDWFSPRRSRVRVEAFSGESVKVEGSDIRKVDSKPAFGCYFSVMLSSPIYTVCERLTLRH